MKKYSYSISVDNPCTQKWSEMTLSDKGKFCSSCSKDVIDFSKLTDKEIIKLIENSEEKLCGNFNNDQLNRLLVETEVQTSRPRLYKILAGFLMLLTVGSANSQSNSSQTEIVSSIQNEDSSLLTKDINRQVSQPSDTLKNIIQGQVLDSNRPLSGTLIFIKNTNTQTITDLDGSFKLIVPDGPIDTFSIQIEHIGYNPIELLINKENLPISKVFFLTIHEVEGEATTGRVGGVSVRRTPIWKRAFFKIKMLFE